MTFSAGSGTYYGKWQNQDKYVSKTVGDHQRIQLLKEVKTSGMIRCPQPLIWMGPTAKYVEEEVDESP